MSPFDFTDYKEFVRERLKSFPRQGHGQYTRIAKLLGIHTTMVSHIFGGDSHLSVEQALKLGEYLALNELETDYFVILVQHSRAGTTESRRYFSRQITKARERAQDLKERLQVKSALDEKAQGIFYSEWYYSAARLLTALDGKNQASVIAETLALPQPLVNRVLEFLVSVDLVRESNGQFVIGQAQTYVTRDSPLVNRHHLNWRMKLASDIHKRTDDDLLFTNPVTLSEADFKAIRERLVQVIEEFRKIANPSPPEELACLAIDWVRIAGESRAFSRSSL